MKLVCEHSRIIGPDWYEALAVGFDLDLPGLFNLEWLIDRAEHGEWSGPWW